MGVSVLEVGEFSTQVQRMREIYEDETDPSGNTECIIGSTCPLTHGVMDPWSLHNYGEIPQEILLLSNTVEHLEAQIAEREAQAIVLTKILELHGIKVPHGEASSPGHEADSGNALGLKRPDNELHLNGGLTRVNSAKETSGSRSPTYPKNQGVSLPPDEELYTLWPPTDTEWQYWQTSGEFNRSWRKKPNVRSTWKP